MEGERGENGGGSSGSPDNLGSAGSTGEALTPDSKNGLDSDLDCGKSSGKKLSISYFILYFPKGLLNFIKPLQKCVMRSIHESFCLKLEDNN